VAVVEEEQQDSVTSDEHAKRSWSPRSADNRGRSDVWLLVAADGDLLHAQPHVPSGDADVPHQGAGTCFHTQGAGMHGT
jgi:hypothetical protein